MSKFDTTLSSKISFFQSYCPNYFQDFESRGKNNFFLLLLSKLKYILNMIEKVRKQSYPLNKAIQIYITRGKNV